LHVDAEMVLVPGLHCLRVFGCEEDATNTGNAVHVGLLRKDAYSELNKLLAG
jgi:hypothetical protein